MLRRAFVLAGLSALLWPVRALGVARAVRLPLAKLKALQQVGGSVSLKLGGVPVLLVRDAADSIRAFSPICTHKKCKVKYSAKRNRLRCTCHKSEFALDGTNLGGPAPRPLPVYQAALNEQRSHLRLVLPE